MNKAEQIIQMFEKLLASSDFVEYSNYRYKATLLWSKILRDEFLPDFLGVDRSAWTPQEETEFKKLHDRLNIKYFNNIEFTGMNSPWAREVAIAEAAHYLSADLSEPRLIPFTILRDGRSWSQHIFRTYGASGPARDR